MVEVLGHTSFSGCVFRQIAEGNMNATEQEKNKVHLAGFGGANEEALSVLTTEQADEQA